MFIIDQWKRSVSLRFITIHKHTHVPTTKSEFYAVFIKSRVGFQSQGFYVQIYSQIYLHVMNETHFIHNVYARV